MVLFKQATLEKIRTGDVTVAFRRWKKPTVRSGGRLRTAIGELSIERVEVVAESALTERAARAAGCASLAELRALLGAPDRGTLYRVTFAFDGADRRVALRQRSELSAAELEQLQKRLASMDARSGEGPWTMKVLSLIAECPAVRAAELAERAGYELGWFKQHVRKLKELGLTESLEVGYRMSPRGEALWRLLRSRKGG